MTRYKTYPEYKDSGVEWLGNIPLDWEVSAIKRIAMVVNGATPKSTEEAFWDGDIPWITPADLGKDSSPYIRRGSRSITRLGYESCGTSMVPVGTIILASRAPIGTLGIATSDLCTNQGCKSLIAKEIHNKFLYYVLLSSKTQLNLLGRGTTFLELSADELGAYEIAFPNGEIQKKIANFLDHETAKIDTLIAKQQELIKLLKEKRQAVISHAVTKGLNPNAPMRDSGVEWLGEVPAHWEGKSFNHLLQHTIDNRGRTPPLVEIGIPMCEVKQVAGNGLYTSNDFEKYITQESYAQYVRSSVKENDILFVTVGATFGKTCLVPADSKFFIAQNVVGFRCANDVEPKYFMFLLSSDVFKGAISATNKSSTIDNVKVSDLVKTKVVVPPLEEQTEILEHILSQFDLFEKLIAKAGQLVILLQERRTALISAAVTGKIDVRDWQPPSESAIAA